GMDADHAVNDEFQASQANTFVGQLGKGERAVRVTDVHHDLERQLRHGVNGVLADIEAQLTFEDQTGIAFGTGHSDALAIFQQIGSVAATDNCWDTQLAGDDRRVAGTAAAVGDDGAGALHYRLPVRIGHVRYQHVTRLDPVHFRNVTNDFHRAGTDTLTNGATFDQHGAFFLQQVALHDIGAAAAFDCFRTCLNDIQLTVVTVLGPFDVHRAAIVLFDDHRLASQVADLLVGKTEAHTLGLV